MVRHENVLKEEQILPVDVRGSKTSVLKLSIFLYLKASRLELQKTPLSRIGTKLGNEILSSRSLREEPKKSLKL